MPAAVRTCPFCQEPLTERAAFCPTCGAATPTSVAREPGVVEDRGAVSAAAVADYRRRLQKALGDTIELRGVLGRGGFAEVYVGWDTRLKRELAVKALRPDLASTPDLVERFRREAEAVANLRHPNIIPIYAVGEGDGVVFFTMPRIVGETLSAVIEREGRMETRLACRVIAEAASALDTAHRAGLIHRDIKPENIMLEGADQRALVMDFGIAKAGGPGAEKGLTGTGMFLGTPDYMSPEQATGARDVDARSDQYSLALVAYRMLTGGRAFESDSMQGMMFKRATVTPPLVTDLNADVPAGVADAIRRALSYDPAQRFASMTEFGAAISSAGLGMTGAGGPTIRRRERDMATRVKEMQAALPSWKHPLVLVAIVAFGAFAALQRASLPLPGYAFAAQRNDAIFAARRWLATRIGGAPELRYAEMIASDSAYRVLQRAYGRTETDARVARDALVWRWRSQFTDSTGSRWAVSVAPGIRVVGFVHTVPDSTARPSVDERAARALAVAELKTFGVSEDSLTWVGDSVIKRAKRTDHVLTWRRRGGEINIGASDTATSRVAVNVVGDRVERLGQGIDVPPATMKALGEKGWVVRGMQFVGFVVIAFLCLGSVVLVVVRQRIDTLQWGLGLRFIVIFGLLVLPIAIVSNIRQLEASSSSQTTQSMIGTVIGIGFVLIFGGGMLLTAMVAAESLAAEFRPHMFDGVNDFLRGRLRTPEMAVAAAWGAIAGGIGLGAMALADYANTHLVAHVVHTSTVETLGIDPPIIPMVGDIAPALFVALAVCFSLVVARRLRTPEAVAIGVIAVLCTGLVGSRYWAEALGVLVTTVVLTVLTWRHGFLTAFVATILVSLFRSLFEIATTGGGTTFTLWIALGMAVSLAPLALGVSAYLIARRRGTGSTSAHTPATS